MCVCVYRCCCWRRKKWQRNSKSQEGKRIVKKTATVGTDFHLPQRFQGPALDQKTFFFMYPSFNDLRPQASKEEEGKKTVFLPFWKEEKKKMKRWEQANETVVWTRWQKKNNSNKRETCEPQMKPRNVLLDLLAAQSMSGATSDMLLISGKGDCVQSPLRESTTHHDRLLLLLDIVYTSTSTEDPTAQNNRGKKNLLSSCQEWKMVAYEEEYRRRGETDFIQSINFIFLAVSLGPAFRESASQRLKDNRDSWLRWRAP